MKKFLLLALSLVMVFSLVACNSNSEPAEKVEGVGQKLEMNNYEYTLNSVELVEERNQYATTDPKYVVKVSYNVKNTSKEALPVGKDVKAYLDGEELATYPLGVTNETLEAGKTVNAIIFFGLNELGEIDLHFLPQLSEEAVQIIKVNVEEKVFNQPESTETSEPEFSSELVPEEQPEATESNPESIEETSESENVE